MIDYKKYFNKKIILVTGGTGSFGNTLISKMLNIGLKEIRVFSRDEKKQDEMRKLYNNNKIKFFIGDVRDPVSIDLAMQNVDYVFHAAALKQVPSCEFFPSEAIKTNIIGTENVIRSAIRNNILKCVILSTDKAVFPINAMGMSKALMEKVVIATSRIKSKTKLMITRYGNVVGSRGSVIPLFIDQIKKKSFVTITHPQMTRFIMTLDEAVELVLFAFINGQNGDIFVKKSPSAHITDIFEALKVILKIKNVEKKIIGVRHSEKMYETLLSSEEMNNAINMKGFFRIPLDNRDLNYNLYFEEGSYKTFKNDSYSSLNTNILTVEKLVKLLKSDVQLKKFFGK